MAMPLIVASVMLLYHERHLSLRTSLSETQRIFTSSWWTGDTETVAARDRPRRANVQQAAFDPNAPLEVALATDNMHRTRAQALALRKRWLPASFMRFIWFCAALFIGMLAYVVGEAYAETYLRTLPHSTIQTIVYVYTWVITVHLLDGLTGWILGGNEGERVGSYPLGWIFKLYVPLNACIATPANPEKLFLPNVPNLRARTVRPSPLAITIRLPSNFVFFVPHHSLPAHYVQTLPLRPYASLHQQPKSFGLSEVCSEEHLYPFSRRMRLYARLPRRNSRIALWSQ
jgi:hypothetical protein